MSLLSKAFSYVLIFMASFAFFGGSAGFLDYFLQYAPNINWQKPLYPEWLQVARWTIGIASGGVFLFGYFLKWSLTPLAMVVVLTLLAGQCAIGTFSYIKQPALYISFVFECLVYIGICSYLFRSKLMVERFGMVGAH